MLLPGQIILCESKTSIEFPILIAAIDEENIYGFRVSSKIKHQAKNSSERNIFNKNIKYVETTTKNSFMNNKTTIYINTTTCIALPKDEEFSYQIIGKTTPQVLTKVIIKWFFQQNNIKDKKDSNYTNIIDSLKINSDITESHTYKDCLEIFTSIPNEIRLQKEYYRKLRQYNNGHLKEKPHIGNDKDKNIYSLPEISIEERILNSSFSIIAKKLGIDKKELNN